MSNLIGTAPNQVPVNGLLGTMAFQDQAAVAIQGGSVTAALTAPDATGYQVVANNYPSTPPSLMLDFANSKALDSRITFTRASTATYYDGMTTAMAEQNLFTYSQTFSNAIWTGSLSGATFSTTTATAPDATSTAATLLASASSTGHLTAWLYSSYAAGTYTLSFFIQAGTNNFASIYFSTGSLSNAICTVNLSTGAVTQTGSNSSITYVSSSITLVTGTWYRVSLTATLASTLSLVAGIQMNNSATPTYVNGGPQTWTAAGTETINIWGAQMEQRASATAYNVTTTAAITNYIPVLLTAASGAARFDSNPTTGESLGLLIEEQRTNLLTYSSDFSNAVWAKGSSIITANTLVAPDGTISADTYTAITASETNIRVSTTQAVSTAYTLSCYAKANTVSFLRLRNIAGVSGTNAWFNLITGTTATVNSGVTASIISVGNGFYRCSITVTTASTIPNNLCDIASANTDASISGVSGDSIYIWGAQLEAGAFATSYIPTVASQVTRADDSATMTGTNFSSWFNISQGSWYSEIVLQTRAVSGSGGSTLGYWDTPANTFAILNQPTTSFAVSTNQSVISSSALGLTKQAAYYSNALIQFSQNGVLGNISTSNVFPNSGVLTLRIGHSYQANRLNGTIKRIAYYPVALTSTQLQTLTT